MPQTREGVGRGLRTSMMAVGIMSLSAWPAFAQSSAGPNAGAIRLTASMDYASAYFFRGIAQDDTGVILQPNVDAGISLSGEDGGRGHVFMNVGTWNSLHTGVTGSDGPGELWYESRFYSTLGVGLGGRTTVGVTFTAYTSPNGMFGNVNEISFRLAVDDSGALGRAALKPYVLLAQELDGQADGGAHKGTYLELGLGGPGFSRSKWSLTVPVRVGLSLGDYYESLAGDDTF
ncbi:MAG TPA: hypothetical protein VFO58_25415, partial [Vicinamibacterales bacterium]|nr:hypothetical protein [Vicinamibacterales bacterium]